jgi:hypothetical protein
MWLSFLLFAGLLFLLVGGVLLGGIFTLVLVPVAIVAALSAVAYLMWARAAGADPAVNPKPDDAPLPHSSYANVDPAPSTPDDVVNARQHP